MRLPDLNDSNVVFSKSVESACISNEQLKYAVPEFSSKLSHFLFIHLSGNSRYLFKSRVNVGIPQTFNFNVSFKHHLRIFERLW